MADIDILFKQIINTCNTKAQEILKEAHDYEEQSLKDTKTEILQIQKEEEQKRKDIENNMDSICSVYASVVKQRVESGRRALIRDKIKKEIVDKIEKLSNTTQWADILKSWLTEAFIIVESSKPVITIQEIKDVDSIIKSAALEAEKILHFKITPILSNEKMEGKGFSISSGEGHILYKITPQMRLELFMEKIDSYIGENL